ncbi:cilia- and flagella-associated protein 100-like [Centropristis striata]|uniref:cilia- and flagella-associated protein 100-like n=1 Tax=Centropristis striata TaxID=184440 RepID=UPI0027DEBAAA|nr:cilia- and flagella-associated protein 100-like [Centropristis striata]
MEKEQRKQRVQRISLVEQVTVRTSRKEDIDRERVLLEIYLMEKRSEIRTINKAMREQQKSLKLLIEILKKENWILEKSLKTTEEKSAEDRILFEKANKSKRENISAIETLNEAKKALKREATTRQYELTEYKRYYNILYKLSPPEWREAQEAKVQSDGDTKQGVKSSPGRELPSIREPTMSSAHSHTLACSVPLLQEKSELYFSDPQQLLDVRMELTAQTLSLIDHSTRADKTVEKLRQAKETTLKKNEEEDRKMTMQVNDMKDRLDQEKERVANLQRKVQLYDSLKATDQDVMLDALDVKVTDVYSCCVDRRLTNLTALEKLSIFEYRMYSLLQQIEKMPEDVLKALRQIKDSKRKHRLLEEKLRLEREKQREMMEKCRKRSQCDPHKKSGRKLLPRCIPVQRKIQVSEDDSTAEEELRAYLFTEDV